MSSPINPYKKQYQIAGKEAIELAYFAHRWLSPANFVGNEYLRSILTNSITYAYSSKPIYLYPKEGARDRAKDLSILAHIETSAICDYLKDFPNE